MISLARPLLRLIAPGHHRAALPLVGMSLLLSSCCLLQRIAERTTLPATEAARPLWRMRVPGLAADQKLTGLTIDDSPSRQTGAILDLLRSEGATATFFVHGDRIRSAADRTVIRRILREGHELANHMPDSFPSATLDPGQFAKEFLRNDSILRAFGASPVRFRPSHGATNRAMEDFMATCGARLGYRNRFYLASNFCWDIYADIPWAYARYTSACATPGRIVVFHDNQDVAPLAGADPIDQSDRTLRALPVYIAELRKQGFRAVSLARLEAAASKR